MKVIIAIAFVFLTIPTMATEDVSSQLLNEIDNSDVLAIFWTGDDGDDCYEPTVEIVSINSDISSAIINVYQNGMAVGCYEQSWQCQLVFSVEGDTLNLVTTESTLECSPL